MKKIVKKILLLTLIALLIAGSSVTAMAAGNDASDFTLFVKSNLKLNGSGLPVVVGGNAIVKNEVTGLEWSKWVEGGFLYAKIATQYTTGQPWYKEEVDKMAYLAKGPYEGSYVGTEPDYSIPLKPFPTFTQKASVRTGNEGLTIGAKESGSWYPTLNITSASYPSGGLTINAPEGTIIEIGANELILDHKITINGTGKVIFYVNKFTSGSSSSINYGGDSSKVMIYLSGTEDSVFNNIVGNFNVYVREGGKSITFNGGGNKKDYDNTYIKGNIYTNGTVNISREIIGFVYAPNSDVTMTSGASIVRGKLVAKNVTIGNSAQIINGPVASLTDGIVKDITQKPKYPVTYATTTGGGFTVTANGTSVPNGTLVEEGTILTITANPDSGYRFVKYEGDVVPDANGNITVTQAITLKAVFELIPTQAGYKNGLLGEYFDSFETLNDSAIRMKRIDPLIAFSFDYDAPNGTNGQVEADTFSERWTGFIKVDKTGDYTFKTYSDDGVKLTVNGELLINRWGLVNLEFTVADKKIHLEEGTYYPIKLEHQQKPLYSAIFLYWEAEDAGVPMGIVPAKYFYVTEKDYNTYKTPQFVNPLLRTGTGLKNSFYNDPEAALNAPSAQAVYTEFNGINYAFGHGSPAGVNNDYFSATMEGFLEGKFTEQATLEFIVDDGIKVWVDGQLIIDAWDAHSDAYITGTFAMERGKKHKIIIAYKELTLSSTCIMRWYSDSQELEIVPTRYLYDK